MISSAFIVFASLVISVILLALTPFQGSSGFPAGVDSAVAGLNYYISYVDVFFPIAPINAVIMFIISFEITLFTFKLLRWLYSFIPWFGGRA